MDVRETIRGLLLEAHHLDGVIEELHEIMDDSRGRGLLKEADESIHEIIRLLKLLEEDLV